MLGALLLVVAALLLAGGADLYTRHVGTMASELRVSALAILVPQLRRGRSRRPSGGILLGTYLLFGVAVLR